MIPVLSCPDRRLLNEALSEWRCWQVDLMVAPEPLQQLPGGRTNRSYLIGSGSWRAVLRLNATNSRDLGIDRGREEMLHRLAAAENLAPDLLYSNPGWRYQVRDYVEGQPWDRNALDSQENRQLCYQLLSRVQSLPVLLPRFDYLAHVECYWQRLQQLGLLTSTLTVRRQEVLPDIRALQEEGWMPVVCHHDFTASNIIERDGALLLLDWEYAACGHPDIDRRYLAPASVDPRVRLLADWINDLWELLQS